MRPTIPKSVEALKRYLLSADQLKQIDPLINEKAIGLFLPYLNRYMPQYGIDTPQRIAAFLGQILHESGHLRYVREIWGPTTQQKRYERNFKAEWSVENPTNKLAFILGNEYKGDGAHFKGHGLIQITGRTNHNICSKALFGDNRLLTEPELLTVPEYAVQSACWYIEWKKLLDELDTVDVVDETKKINGGTNGLSERRELKGRALEVLTA